MSCQPTVLPRGPVPFAGLRRVGCLSWYCVATAQSAVQAPAPDLCPACRFTAGDQVGPRGACAEVGAAGAALAPQRGHSSRCRSPRIFAASSAPGDPRDAWNARRAGAQVPAGCRRAPASSFPPTATCYHHHVSMADTGRSDGGSSRMSPRGRLTSSRVACSDRSAASTLLIAIRAVKSCNGWSPSFRRSGGHSVTPASSARRSPNRTRTSVRAVHPTDVAITAAPPAALCSTPGQVVASTRISSEFRWYMAHLRHPDRRGRMNAAAAEATAR